MAFEDFWRNVRRAARLIRSEGVVADSQRFPSEEIAKHLATGAFWLTPGAVGDYDEADFAFLERDEVAQLSKSVLRFRQLAQTVNPRGPVTREQLAEAIPLFQVIIERLEFERFADS